MICWSAGAQALWGYTPGEIVGRPLADLFGAGGSVLQDREGRSVDADTRLHPLSADERPAGFLLTAERGTASDARPPDDELTRWLFEQYPSPLVVYDRQARVMRVNQAVCRAMGVSEDEVRNRLTTDIVQGSAYSAVEQGVLRVSETGEPESIEIFVKVPSEPRAHAWSMDVFPLKDSAHRDRAVGVSAFDYSEQYGSR